MNQYENFMRYVYTHGVDKSDRTGTGTRSLFGHQMRFNLQESCILAAFFLNCSGFCEAIQM